MNTISYALLPLPSPSCLTPPNVPEKKFPPSQTPTLTTQPTAGSTLRTLSFFLRLHHLLWAHL